MAILGRVCKNWFRLCVVIIAIYTVCLCCMQHLQYREVNAAVGEARIRLENLQQVNAQMQQEKQNLSNPAYIEKVAREDWGLVKPGEVPYRR